jgi:hypothetical protein
MKPFALLSLGLLTALTLSAAPSAPKFPTASERFGSLDKADDASFRRHVIPLFSRTGCSGRECHGAFAGQGGFQLSLFGYDFENDFKEITQDADGGEAEVRVNKDKAIESLILTKATATTKHKGKERFAQGSWEYNLVLKWIQSGAKFDLKETGEFDRLEVTPTEIVFKKTGETAQLRVLAHWKDGTVEDVTQLTRFRTNDESVSTVSDTGKVTSVGPGDTHIVAFYDNGVHPVPVILPFNDKSGSRYPRLATRTKVDELVVAKLRKLGIVPSAVCTDEEFLRRASLDVTGTLPTPSEVREFLADRSPDKRAKKIDELLNRPGYAAWFTTLLCDFTGNNPQQLNDGGGLIRNLNGEQSRRWYDWIYERVAANTPYDELAAGIVLATTRSSPDQSYEELAKEMAAYYRSENPADFADRDTMPYFWARRNVRMPQEKALAFSHSFLGVRIECAECHKHPFDQWTKQDFEQFKAFFEAISHGPNRVAKDEGVTYASLTQDIRNAVTNGKAVDPRSKAGQDQNRQMQQEAQRRIRAGELVPWNEVFVDARRTPQPARKDRKEVKGSARVITPKILGGEEVMLQQYSDPRQPLMDWMRAPENPYFARAFVNRVWANYFGRGIVEPVDDLNLANPPVNEALMDHLAEGFVRHNFDMKWLHREILTSDTYQRSWQPNETNKLDEKNFSRMNPRRVPAEVAMDAIKLATAASADLSRFVGDVAKRNIGPGADSYNRRGNSGYALATFGKPARVANCDCERTADPTLLQTLFTRNDPELIASLEGDGRNAAWINELRRLYGANQKELAKVESDFNKSRAARQAMREKLEKRLKAGEITREDIAKLRADLKTAEDKEAVLSAKLNEQQGKPAEMKVDEIIQEVFLRTVSRLPKPEEMARAREDIAAAKEPVDGVRDLLWAMLNTREFLVNH